MMQSLSVGSFLHGGSYRIEKILGQGGFGITYLATDMNLQRLVAIKEFFPKEYCDRDATTSQVSLGTKTMEEFVNRLKAKFLKEARNIAKLNHPNIIRIYSAFEENNTAYYVMEYIEGGSVAERVKRDGAMGEKEAVGYVEKVGKALEYVHARRINHLDVKPGNILVRESDDTPILIDFGLSKQYDAKGQQTSTNPVGHSHGYAPMEQYRDGGVKEFSPKTDLYSLAATLYYMLSGVVPPQATALVEEGLPFPAAIPPRLLPPLSKAMSSARCDRHETIGEFLREIRPPEPKPVRPKIVEPKPVEPAPTPEVITTPEPKSRTKWYVIGAAAVVAVAVVLGIIFIPDRKPETDNPPLPVDITGLLTDSVKKVNNIYYKSSLGACAYTGEVDSVGQPHGKGRAEWETGIGKWYDGQWLHGEMDGECTYLNSQGYRFEGRFKAGHYAEGKLISPDKTYYVGTFDSNGNKYTGTEYDAQGRQTDTWLNGE